MPSKSVSLTDYAAAAPNLRAKCRVCALPPDVLAEVRAAKGQLQATVVVRWLRDVHGIMLHNNGAQIRTCWAQHT